MVLRVDQEKASYTQKVDFAQLRSELLAADSSESTLTRASHERLAGELAKLNGRLRDEVQRTLASVRLDLSSSGAPSHASRPRSRINTRSAKSKARSICCSTRTIVTSPDAARREIMAMSSSQITGARPSSGSSSSSKDGFPRRVRAIANICCSPPDNCMPR